MRLHHLAFRTDDVPRLARFYEEGLGLARLPAREGVVWLALEGGAILMIEPRGEGERARAEDGDLVCFEVGHAHRAHVVARLLGAGARPDGATAFTTYVRDPDGRRIGVSHFPHRAG